MQKFEYRSPRYDVDLAVRLISGGSSVAGRCREISKDGLCARFSERPEVGSHGKLILNYRNHSFEVPVRVAHAGTNAEGLKFLFSSEAHRKDVDRLVADIAAEGPHAGPVLVK